MDHLDEVDPRRFDAEAICDKLNEFEKLSETEPDSYEQGSLEFSGLIDAEHSFSALLLESDNATAVVRDLDGSLYLLWNDLRTGQWNLGPLTAANLDPDRDEHELDQELVRQIIDALPAIPGASRTF